MYMAESIPLGATLSVQSVRIIVGNAINQTLDVVLELLPAKSGCLGNIEGEATWLSEWMSQFNKSGRMWVGLRAVVLSCTTVIPRRCNDSREAHSNRTISPVVISAAAALTR